MNEFTLCDILTDLLNDSNMEGMDYYFVDYGLDRQHVRVSTYEDVGMLTTSPGILIRFEDGSEFALSCTRRKGPKK